MSYDSKFQDIDSVLDYLDGIEFKFHDPFEKKLAGLVCVMAVTAYELAIKEIFIEFARKEYKPCSLFIDSYFNRINGRIKIENIKGQYISYFGGDYKETFGNRLKKIPENTQRSYDGLIEWRHDFAHTGNITAGYDKVTGAYEEGKEVIHCLASCMGVTVQSPPVDSDLEPEAGLNGY